MRLDILTIFPELFASFLATGLPRIAAEKGLVAYQLHDLRDYSADKHRKVDDTTYGGGPGMVMRPAPFFNALETIAGEDYKRVRETSRIVLLTPAGEPLGEAMARDLAEEEHIWLLAARYEGVDWRVHNELATDEVSIGDYVLSGGEVPAMVVMEAVVRRVAGVLEAGGATEEESFAEGLLEYPQYTKPAEYRGMAVPEVLLSGNHEEIRRWRRKKALEATLRRRPDLLTQTELTPEDKTLLEEIRARKP